MDAGIAVKFKPGDKVRYNEKNNEPSRLFYNKVGTVLRWDEQSQTYRLSYRGKHGELCTAAFFGWRLESAGPDYSEADWI